MTDVDARRWQTACRLHRAVLFEAQKDSVPTDVSTFDKNSPICIERACLRLPEQNTNTTKASLSLEKEST